MVKNLKDIVQFLQEVGNITEYVMDDVVIDHISHDSRDLQSNTLFFCKGVKFKVDYLTQACENGAVAYIAETKIADNVPYIIVEDIRLAMMQIAGFFYDYPDKKINVIGITGTKGKSSTVFYVKYILDEFCMTNGDKPVGLLSTIKNYDGGEWEDSVLSTPEPISLYRYLYNAVNNGLKYMIVEASSQAFKAFRMNALKIDVAALLNIGEDHVSPLEHPDFQDYFNCKLKIFDNATYAVYNKDMDFSETVQQRLEEKGLSYADVSCQQSAKVRLVNKVFADDMLDFSVAYGEEELQLSLKQLGDYNIENAMIAVAIAKYFNVDNMSIFNGLYKAVIDGREALVQSVDKKFVVFTNYAHNGLSLDRSFEFIKQRFPGYYIYIVFGVNGNLAKNRVEGMSRSAGTNADYVFVSPDDPGDTPLEVIYETISKELSKYTQSYERNDSRENAAYIAYQNRKDKTVIFLAGMGAEDSIKGSNNTKIYIKNDVQVGKELVDLYNRDHTNV